MIIFQMRIFLDRLFDPFINFQRYFLCLNKKISSKNGGIKSEGLYNCLKLRF
jgi:hypothetical protein